jgi:streptogramin lyase
MICGAVAALAVACSDNQWSPDGGDADADGDSDGDSDGDGDSDSDSDGDVCIDDDGDGYGPGCAAGPDCDDEDSTEHEGCVFVRVGRDGERWNPTDDNSNGVHVDDDGDLTLESRPQLQPAVWVANSGEGTISRLDPRTGNEIARYPSVLDWMSGSQPPHESCNFVNTGNCPSRTAIDFRGDCWVANRAFMHQGTVTKIAAHLNDCIDRDADGVIQTSRDINGDGRIDLGSDEYLGTDDECVLFTVNVGGIDGMPRALAIAPSGDSSGGNAWVGLNGERSVVEINGDTGAIVQTITVPLNPYGALASKYQGLVWITNAGWQRDVYDDNPPAIVSISFRTGEVSPRYEVRSDTDCVGTYGLTVASDGRVWTTGHRCHDAFRFDPETSNWATIRIPESGVSRGIVADAEGWIWVAHSRLAFEPSDSGFIGLITRFRTDGSDLTYYHLPTGLAPVGVDVDADGMIWTVNRETDNAARIDPRTGDIMEVPVGDWPYTYSDFTGHSLLLHFPRGYYREVLEACPNATWSTLSWSADTPVDTRVEFRVRSASTAVGLATADWVGPFEDSPANLQAPPGPVPDGAFLELEIILISESISAVPSVGWVELSYECPIG